MTETEMIDWIDSADLESLLRRQRFAPLGSPWFSGSVGDHFGEVLGKRRREAGPEAWTATSKKIGWEK